MAASVRNILVIIVALAIVLNGSPAVNGIPHGGGGVVLVPGAVVAPVHVVPVVPVVAPVVPYYAVPKRCARKPHKCNYYYGHPPPPPPPPRPYYGHYGHGGPPVKVAAFGVGVAVGK